ncbi:hypothetical protein STEG23_010245 [Scotinomys teguina]
MWYMYTMEYYTAEKNNDIMKFAGKWMELENVILSKSCRTPPTSGISTKAMNQIHKSLDIASNSRKYKGQKIPDYFKSNHRFSRLWKNLPAK